MCCSVLQCVAVCCNEKASLRYAGDIYELTCAAVCSVLQCVAVCCSVLQCVAVGCGPLDESCHMYEWVMSHGSIRHI